MSRAAVAPTSRVHVRAPGKVNVFFEVGDRQDDGYHDVASVYQAVSAWEDVHAERAEGFSVSVSGLVDTSGVPLDDRNLALRAARLLARRAGYEGGVHLDIVKSVPVAGGMGGGSADAAAALVACDALWGTGQTPQQLHALAARLGADVPFALMGGTAVGTGRGDELSPALAAGRFDWVLAMSDEGMSTPAVYAALDRRREAEALDIRPSRQPVAAPAVLQALRAGDPHLLAPHLRNDLQDAALDLRPDLAETLAIGERHGALVGIVSGSGPTVAFLVDGETAALDLQVTLAASGRVVEHVHGPVHGAKVMAR